MYWIKVLVFASVWLFFPSVVTDDLNMNAVMRLNQYRPGLEYRLTSQSGPVHEPVFTMAVDLNGKSYEATGPSKRAAKLNVATKARLFLFLLPLNCFLCQRGFIIRLHGIQSCTHTWSKLCWFKSQESNAPPKQLAEFLFILIKGHTGCGERWLIFEIKSQTNPSAVGAPSEGPTRQKNQTRDTLSRRYQWKLGSIIKSKVAELWVNQ